MQTAPAPLADAAGIRVTIGGQSATVYYAGMTVAGGYQINAAVPTLPDGDYEVAATVGSRTTKVNVWLTVRR